jgi:hypothetical protein
LQKLALLGLIILTLYGCSVFNKGSKNFPVENGNDQNVSYLDGLRSGNLTEKSFYIKSVDIDYTNDSDINHFNASIRFEKPDKYLIALRSRTGIELTRVLITRDSLFITDRLKHIIYYGNVRYLEKKFEIRADLLPVIFGDIVGRYVLDKNSKTDKNNRVIDSKISGISLKYVLDGTIGKAVSVKAEKTGRVDIGTISFSRFRSMNGSSYPSRVLLENKVRNISAALKIKKIEVPWSEKIDFSITKRYKLVELL